MPSTQDLAFQMKIPAGLGPRQINSNLEELHHAQSSETVMGDDTNIHNTSRGDVGLTRATTIALRDPLLAVALFIGSTLTAVGHHLYYESLDRAPVGSEGQQVWAIRIGTGLAFLTRSGLAATLGIIAVQQSWATLRKRAMTIGGIDSMFGIMSNPWLFLNKDLLVHAKRICVLAAISWLVSILEGGFSHSRLTVCSPPVGYSLSSQSPHQQRYPYTRMQPKSK